MNNVNKLIVVTVISFLTSNTVFAGIIEDVAKWNKIELEEQAVKLLLSVKSDELKTLNNWPERKEALQMIVQQHPESRYADDAWLKLACGKYEYEGDTEGAIKILEDVIDKFSTETTNLDPMWAVGHECEYNFQWTMATRYKFALMNGYNQSNNKQDMMKQYREEPYLVSVAYLNHLEQYPIMTSEVARLYMATILIHEQRYEKAINQLEMLTDKTEQNPGKVQADIVAVTGQYNELIRSINRPYYLAARMLAGCYKNINNTIEMKKHLDAFASVVNQGYLYEIIEQVGDMYDEAGFTKQANVQYESAIKTIQKAHELKASHVEMKIKASAIKQNDEMQGEMLNRMNRLHLKIERGNK